MRDALDATPCVAMEALLARRVAKRTLGRRLSCGVLSLPIAVVEFCLRRPPTGLACPGAIDAEKLTLIAPENPARVVAASCEPEPVTIIVTWLIRSLALDGPKLDSTLP